VIRSSLIGRLILFKAQIVFCNLNEVDFVKK
jgi:hypothetical protein